MFCARSDGFKCRRSHLGRLLPAAAIALSGLPFDVAARPPQEIVTGTNTGKQISQPVYDWGDWIGGDVEPTEKAITVGRQLARCVVDHRPEGAKAALDAADREGFRSATSRLNTTMVDCLKYGEFELQPAALAGLLAEAWFAHSETPRLPPTKYEPNAPKLDFMANGPASLVQLRLGECLASRYPVEVRQLVSAKPGGSDENTALGVVLPLLPACLDKNVTLHVTRNSLRLPLTYALYRRTLNPAPAAAVESPR